MRPRDRIRKKQEALKKARKARNGRQKNAISVKFQMKQIDHWVDSMKGQPVFIIGNGPSLIDKDIKFLEDYFTIGINRAFFKLDPTILMWQDLALWTKEKQSVSSLKAIKFCFE